MWTRFPGGLTHYLPNKTILKKKSILKISIKSEEKFNELNMTARKTRFFIQSAPKLDN